MTRDLLVFLSLFRSLTLFLVFLSCLSYDPVSVLQAEEERSRVKRELEMATRAQEEQQRRDERTLRATSQGPDHDKTCVFSALTHSHPLDNGSSFVFKKKAKASGSSSSSEPASRSAYIAVQKGDTDIPLSGLQKPAPQPKAHKGMFYFPFHISLMFWMHDKFHFICSKHHSLDRYINGCYACFPHEILDEEKTFLYMCNSADKTTSTVTTTKQCCF